MVIACLATNKRSTNRADQRVAVWAGRAGTAFVPLVMTLTMGTERGLAGRSQHWRAHARTHCPFPRRPSEGRQAQLQLLDHRHRDLPL